MAFCTECGANVPDGVKFCTACGKPIGSTIQPEPVQAAVQPIPAVQVPAAQMTQTSSAPAAQYMSSQPLQTAAMDAPPPAGSRYAVMSTGSFILTSILFAIPVVGFAACLVMAFAAKNLNRKHFARAMLIFMVIGLVMSIILFFLGRWVSDAVISYLNEASGITGSTSDLGELFRFFNNQ